MADYPKVLTKGYQADIDKLDLEEGKLRFAIDTARLFLDTATKRIEFTDIIRTMSENQILALKAPLPKVYLATDTHKMYIYTTNDGWIVCGGGSSTSEEAEKATYDSDGNKITETYAPLNSPKFVGKPEVPTPASNDNSSQVPNTSWVVSKIEENVSSVASLNALAVDSLPETGEHGIIYFVKKEEGNSDIYIYDNSNEFKKIGTTDIKLNEYIKDIDQTGTGNAVTSVEKSTESGKLIVKKDSTFLTEHPPVKTSSDKLEETVGSGGTFQCVDNIKTDENGHLINYRVKTVRIPEASEIGYNFGWGAF